MEKTLERIVILTTAGQRVELLRIRLNRLFPEGKIELIPKRREVFVASAPDYPWEEIRTKDTGRA
jgi:hypothetical protein